jgi:enoyl-CoA hydratase/carnithine racemase
MTDYTTLRLERAAEGVALVTLDRPERMNAITFRMFEEWHAVCAEVAGDDDLRALVLTGAGRAFCAGLDLVDAGTLSDMTVPEMMRGQESWADATAAFHRLPKPVIAAVNGAAAGAGFSLALAADIRLASPEARFNAAFVRIGLSGGDCGTSWFLPRVVGLGRAAEILLTGRFVGADEAAGIGLVNRVVPKDDLVHEAIGLAQQIATNTPFGVTLTKRVLHLNVDAPSLTAALEVENRNQVLTTRTHDMAEALTAFQEKRPPRYTGR